MLFVPRAQHWATLSALNSAPFVALLHLLMARGTRGGQTLKYESGYVGVTPLPVTIDNNQPELAALSQRGWSVRRSLDTRSETSHAFTLPALLQVAGDTLAARAVAWHEHVCTVEAELAAIQAEIDRRCFSVYGIGEPDRRLIVDGFGSSCSEESSEAHEADPELDAENESNDEAHTDASALAAELIAWAVGTAFGRFDVRLATGTMMLPSEPEPFEPLPASSPAMLIGDDGLPLGRVPTGYSINFPENGLLEDDPGDPQDLTTAVRAVFEEVFGASAEGWWNEVGALLDSKSHNPRAWLTMEFFEYHLKRYSKSRRKAPIIWQIAVPSGRYSVWVYAHRVTRDTFVQIQNDVVVPKLVDEERRLANLIQGAGANPTAKESKEIETQEALVGELRDLLDKVKRVAPLWCPTLDDGVVLTMAPLWQLVPQHKSWQKELKSKWDELAAGKYDWAHIAMHLWPERVVPKCAEDRSLAIAHGLEDVFWFEDADGKWKSNKKPQKSVASLVGERTSAAVKAALKSLLDAPEPTAGAKRGRKSKAA